LKALITFAVDAEFAPWRRLRPFARLEKVDSYRCNIGEMEVLVVFTGMGARKPWLETVSNVWGRNIDICISSGLAGALQAAYSVGEIVAPRTIENVCRKTKLACDAEMTDLAKSCGAQIVPLLRTVDHVVLSADEKHELGQSGDAVDMETSEILAHAAALGAHVVCVRAISDSASEDLPLDFNRVVTGEGDVSLPRVLGQIALHPSSLPGLVKFGRQSRAAAGYLAEFLERYVPGLAKVYADKAPQEISAR
jgi:nucleoside phosphorylase